MIIISAISILSSTSTIWRLPSPDSHSRNQRLSLFTVLQQDCGEKSQVPHGQAACTLKDVWLACSDLHYRKDIDVSTVFRFCHPSSQFGAAKRCCTGVRKHLYHHMSILVKRLHSETGLSQVMMDSGCFCRRYISPFCRMILRLSPRHLCMFSCDVGS